MMTTLPRPSRPSFGPPDAPLPQLPISKSRKSLGSPASPSGSRRGSGASLLPAPSRAVSSALPTRPSALPAKKQHGSTSNLVSPVSGPAQPLRKTISIGAFPQPPKSTHGPSSSGNSPDSSSPTQQFPDRASRASSRDSSQKRGPRQSASRVSSMRPYNSGMSFLNGGEGKSVSLLALPSPPASRPSSSQGSYADNDGEEPRGRSTTTDDKFDDKYGKDGKGNVIVSVRVRPDVASNDREKSDLEWMVDGRRSLIAYRGREGGDYSYGESLCLPCMCTI
jgi:centromeric protein E